MARIASGFIALMYVVLAALHFDAEAAMKVGTFLVFPLFCIWFSEAIGDFTGFAGRSVTTASPGWMIAIGGWILLFVPALLAAMWLMH